MSIQIVSEVGTSMGAVVPLGGSFDTSMLLPRALLDRDAFLTLNVWRRYTADVAVRRLRDVRIAGSGLVSGDGGGRIEVAIPPRDAVAVDPEHMHTPGIPCPSCGFRATSKEPADEHLVVHHGHVAWLEFEDLLNLVV
jgi:hypothetical protein